MSEGLFLRRQTVGDVEGEYFAKKKEAGFARDRSRPLLLEGIYCERRLELGPATDPCWWRITLVWST